MDRPADDQSFRLLLTVNETCGRLHLSRPVVYGLINSGALRSLKVGKARRIPAKALEEYIAAQLASSEESSS